mgnify:CR=1 FL=1
MLDEPTSFLDIRHKLELLSILRSMAKEKGITVIMSLHEIDLAQKIADQILCVKGDHVCYYGTPEQIFEEQTIRELYGIENGFYDPRFGSIELPKVEGEPEVFVIAGCGRGIPIYRKLQKDNIPFATGILYTNDVDYQLARLLAARVITEEPFLPDHSGASPGSNTGHGKKCQKGDLRRCSHRRMQQRAGGTDPGRKKEIVTLKKINSYWCSE